MTVMVKMMGNPHHIPHRNGWKGLELFLARHDSPIRAKLLPLEASYSYACNAAPECRRPAA